MKSIEKPIFIVKYNLLGKRVKEKSPEKKIQAMNPYLMDSTVHIVDSDITMVKNQNVFYGLRPLINFVGEDSYISDYIAIDCSESLFELAQNIKTYAKYKINAVITNPNAQKIVKKNKELIQSAGIKIIISKIFTMNAGGALKAAEFARDKKESGVYGYENAVIRQNLKELKERVY